MMLTTIHTGEVRHNYYSWHKREGGAEGFRIYITPGLVTTRHSRAGGNPGKGRPVEVLDFRLRGNDGLALGVEPIDHIGFPLSRE